MSVSPFDVQSYQGQWYEIARLRCPASRPDVAKALVHSGSHLDDDALDLSCHARALLAFTASSTHIYEWI